MVDHHHVYRYTINLDRIVGSKISKISQFYQSSLINIELIIVFDKPHSEIEKSPSSNNYYKKK